MWPWSDKVGVRVFGNEVISVMNFAMMASMLIICFPITSCLVLKCMYGTNG